MNDFKVKVCVPPEYRNSNRIYEAKELIKVSIEEYFIKQYENVRDQNISIPEIREGHSGHGCDFYFYARDEDSKNIVRNIEKVSGLFTKIISNN